MQPLKKTPLSSRFIKRSDNTAINAVIDNPNCTFLGGLSDQPFTAFYVWEKFFSKFGERMQRFIEFGCDQGNTSCYFVLQCLNAGVEYTGFDKRRKSLYTNTPVKRLLRLHKRMILGNGYKKVGKIRELIQSKGMSVIFSDCIDKPWEFDTFAPMLKKGDVLAMHDWDRAIKDEWVLNTIRKLRPFRLLYEAERLELNTLTRFFIKE